ncbi:hypothetical protein [uncultured Flavobacterium sp.]|uniref:hypothetical protein n=1 Tax=uncultured Flavobacterium sp. TaxID=165435 RepID=UPI0029306D1E|nr:hypothetical protein [uncultured Flavobacterium sp.]
MILIIICSCSSDNSNESDQNLNKGLLKSVAYGKDGGSDYEYENGFLTKLTTNLHGTILQYEYKYDNKGRLLSSKFNGKEECSFIYDSQDRLIKVIKVDTADYATLEYLPNKIIVTNHYETFYAEPLNLVSEVYTDSIGRIVKTVQLTATSANQYLVCEFKYDNNNNVLQTVLLGNADTNRPDLISNFEYDNKKNPQYISNKYYYRSLYYWIFSNSTSINSPNNIISNKSATVSSANQITYNSDNCPVTNIHSVYQENSTVPSSTTTVLYEYY